MDGKSFTCAVAAPPLTAERHVGVPVALICWYRVTESPEMPAALKLTMTALAGVTCWPFTVNDSFTADRPLTTLPLASASEAYVELTSLVAEVATSCAPLGRAPSGADTFTVTPSTVALSVVAGMVSSVVVCWVAAVEDVVDFELLAAELPDVLVDLEEVSSDFWLLDAASEALEDLVVSWLDFALESSDAAFVDAVDAVLASSSFVGVVVSVGACSASAGMGVPAVVMATVRTTAIVLLNLLFLLKRLGFS